MKRITNIRIENYKAYIQSTEFQLPNGENLLLYGENGSGKSSLYKALHHFMASSVDASKSFDINYYSGLAEGVIEITCADYDLSTKTIIPNSNQILLSSHNPTLSTNNVDFVNTGFRVSGFLDYATLLKVYLNKGARPNLFELIMELLSEYVGTKYGFKDTIGSIYFGINNNIKKAYHRRDRIYRQNKVLFDKLAAAFPQIINDINVDFSNYMRTYFDGFKLNISLANATMGLNESGHIRDTHIFGKVFLDVQYYGQQMQNYNYTLNEARLSAIAICLYLASLKLRAMTPDFRILYFDDVFIGLDTSNRKPVLRILKDHFSDYQIFISTYDKSWYMMVREFFNDESMWEYKELYESSLTMNGVTLPHPLVIAGESDIMKARRYLYNPAHPDYPAAANYMRKAFENLFTNAIFRPAILCDGLEPIAAFKLTNLLRANESFLQCIIDEAHAANILKYIGELKASLKPMLHPLSHYVPDEPIYKNELIEADKIYNNLIQECKVADYKQHCKVLVEKGHQIMFKISGIGWTMEYIFEVGEHLISYEDKIGNRKITKVPLQIVEFSEIIHGKGKTTCIVNSKMKLYANMCYTDLDDCVTKISTFLKTPQGGSRSGVTVLPNINDMFFCIDVVSSPSPTIEFSKVLSSLI